MKKTEIVELIVDNTSVSTEQAKIIAIKIYLLHIQSQIDLLEKFVEHPTKPGYERHDVLDKINELKKRTKK